MTTLQFVVVTCFHEGMGKKRGSWVVYDPYWDPVSSHATEAEAEEVARKSGCHVIFDPKGMPGHLRGDNFGHWDEFLERHAEPPSME